MHRHSSLIKGIYLLLKMRRKREFIQREILISYFFTCLEASYENMSLYLYRQTERYLIEMSKKYENSQRFGKNEMCGFYSENREPKKGVCNSLKNLKWHKNKTFLGQTQVSSQFQLGGVFPCNQNYETDSIWK